MTAWKALALAALWALAAGSVRAEVVLVRDHRAEAVICLPGDAPEGFTDAADTLRRYVREISRAQLPVVSGRPAQGPRILVEIDSDAGLGPDGFHIRTAKGDLLFTVETARGFRHAVYTFLESHLGCRMYSPTVQVIPRRATIALGDIDDRQVPPILFRMQNLHAQPYTEWHKLDTRDDFGLFVHTFDDLVPPQRYFAEHPEYFSLLNGNRTPQGQLCLTNPEVLRIVVDELRRLMREKPEAVFWSVSQNDTYAPCECDACRAVDEVEGSQSGSILAFVNRVAAEFPDRTISTLAYQYSRAAPRTLKPLPNVNVMLCSIECNRSRPLADDPGSASFVRDVRDWSALTSNIFLWDYVIQYRNLVSPFPNLRVLQPNIRFFRDSGITTVFEQGLSTMAGEFSELRTYLIAKLLWNPDTDADAVIDDFLAGYYGDAAPFLRRYIDLMHDRLEESGEGLSIYGYPVPSADGYLSPPMLDAYEDLLTQAEAAVADDPDLLLRARTAHLPVQFARLEQAKMAGPGERGCFVPDADGSLRVRPGIAALLETFVAVCVEAGIPGLWEHGTHPQQYLTMTRRFLADSTAPHLGRGRKVVLARPASPKYHGGEASALTDGCRGWDDYHFHWLGFEGEDLEAVIDLGAVRNVSRVSADFLQDINSWIFMPLSVTVSLSEDGRAFREIGRVMCGTSPEAYGPIIEPFAVACEPASARYVRLAADSREVCPSWHKGSGGPAWIFTDEIVVR
ncbi:MAG: DUF4838 domain-containing protein [Candidatus Krumholzibacteriia bacterium]